MIPAKPLAVLLLIVFCAHAVHAQSSTTAATISENTTKTATSEKDEFPQWARDLRRGEIIAFGTFPLTMFFATFAIDTIRAANHGWDSRYLPWPLKSSGAALMDTREHMITISTAVITSVALALTDYLIVRIKRAKMERERQALPEGELIILRKPWPPEEAPQDGTGDGEGSGTP